MEQLVPNVNLCQIGGLINVVRSASCGRFRSNLKAHRRCVSLDSRLDSNESAEEGSVSSPLSSKLEQINLSEPDSGLVLSQIHYESL